MEVFCSVDFNYMLLYSPFVLILLYKMEWFRCLCRMFSPTRGFQEALVTPQIRSGDSSCVELQSSDRVQRKQHP